MRLRSRPVDWLELAYAAMFAACGIGAYAVGNDGSTLTPLGWVVVGACVILTAVHVIAAIRAAH